MIAQRYLIVNADDFGQSPGINRGVIEAHENGIVTSASLMVRWPAAAEAAQYARAHPDLSVGLHLDLCEWECRDDNWSPLYEVVPTEDAAAVAAEVDRQMATFQGLLGRNPTHLDSHQHVHKTEPVRSIMIETARRLRIPLRDCDPEIAYSGRFYGQSANGYPYPEGISIESLLATIRGLPSGVIKLGCHPGLPDDLNSMYRAERIQEVRVLCDRRAREGIDAEGIQLRSFLSIATELRRELEAEVA